MVGSNTGIESLLNHGLGGEGKGIFEVGVLFILTRSVLGMGVWEFFFCILWKLKRA